MSIWFIKQEEARAATKNRALRSSAWSVLN